MEKITRRSALKRMGATVIGATVFSSLPSFAKDAMGLSEMPQGGTPQDSKPADGVRPPRGYDGRISYMSNHQMFDLGGISLEAVYASGHTRDSVMFIDRKNHMGLSGDAFGSTNLLMTCELSTFIRTAEDTLKLMCEQEIYYMLPGHFDGTNAETSKRVYDLWVIANDVLAGRKVGEKTSSGMGLNRRCTYEGVRFNYNDSMLK